MNLLTGIDKKSPQVSVGSIGSDGSNSTGVATESALSMHQIKGNSASFTLK